VNCFGVCVSSVLLLRSKICGHCVHTKHKSKKCWDRSCSSQGWTRSNTGCVLPYCMVIHFLCCMVLYGYPNFAWHRIQIENLAPEWSRNLKKNDSSHLWWLFSRLALTSKPCSVQCSSKSLPNTAVVSHLGFCLPAGF